jgi:mannose-6-phosphate isomerase
MALSIQLHPDEQTAQRLHKEQPLIYKDPNPKPEIAIALSDDFVALAGFADNQTIV